MEFSNLMLYLFYSRVHLATYLLLLFCGNIMGIIILRGERPETIIILAIVKPLSYLT